jgi:hypothetical protein
MKEAIARIKLRLKKRAGKKALLKAGMMAVLPFGLIIATLYMTYFLVME